MIMLRRSSYKDKCFGFITLDDGGDDVFTRWKELPVEGLQHGDTVLCDSDYDDRKRKYRARHCIVISGSSDGSGRRRHGASRHGIRLSQRKTQGIQLLRLSEPIPLRDLPQKHS